MMNQTFKIDHLPKLEQEQNQQQSQLGQQQSQLGQQQNLPDQQQSQPNNDFISVDDLLTEYDSELESTSLTEPTGIEPGGEKTFEPISTNEQDRSIMDESEARKQTIIAMTMRQTLQSYGIAWYADGSFRTDYANQYNYTPADFNKLVDAWLPVVQSANLRIPPFANILMTEAICTGPLIGLMAQNRKMRKQLEYYKNKERAENSNIAKKLSTRPDTKTAWSIGYNGNDVYGYFTHQPNGTYIPKQHRTQRPELTKENIELLIKHNGQEAIDRLKGGN